MDNPPAGAATGDAQELPLTGSATGQEVPIAERRAAAAAGDQLPPPIEVEPVDAGLGAPVQQQASRRSHELSRPTTPARSSSSRDRASAPSSLTPALPLLRPHADSPCTQTRRRTSTPGITSTTNPHPASCSSGSTRSSTPRSITRSTRALPPPPRLDPPRSSPRCAPRALTRL